MCLGGVGMGNVLRGTLVVDRVWVCDDEETGSPDVRKIQFTIVLENTTTPFHHGLLKVNTI